MVGQPGWELFGRWETATRFATRSCRLARSSGFAASARERIRRAASNRAGFPRRFRRSIRAKNMKPYREWLSSKSYEAMASLGGSFYSKDIRDYYLTPYDLGYGPFVKFDHEFIGGRRSKRWPPSRGARRSRWSGTAKTWPGCSARCSATARLTKYIDLPLANYATLPYDKVLKGGQTIGVSTYTGYTYNERAMRLAGHGRRRRQRAGHAGRRSSGARKAAGRRSRPSNGTRRWKSARPWRRCRFPTSRASGIVLK